AIWSISHPAAVAASAAVRVDSSISTISTASPAASSAALTRAKLLLIRPSCSQLRTGYPAPNGRNSPDGSLHAACRGRAQQGRRPSRRFDRRGTDVLCLGQG